MSTIDQLLQEAYLRWGDAAALSRVGRELQSRNRLDHARRVLERAVELDPNDEDAWAYLAYSCYRSLRTQEGHAVLERGIAATGADGLKSIRASFHDDEAEAERLRAEIADTADPGTRAGLISQRFWKGEHETSLAALRALRAEHPESPDVRETMLWTLLWARNRNVVEDLDLQKEGLPLVEEAILEKPDSMSGYWMKLMMLQAEKDWDGLLETTAQVLDRFPDEETVMQFRARAYRETGDADRATHWLLRAIGAKASFAGARVELGKLYEEQEKLDLAEEVFREIPDANPDYPLGPVSLALFLARRERWDEAERTFVAAWPNVPGFFRDSVRQNPQAKALLERDAVRRVVEAD